MKRVLVIGATGFVGTYLVQQLTRRAYEVRVFNRSSGDLLDPGAVRRAAAGVDLVFHLAAKVHDSQPRTREEFHRINVMGSESVIAAVQDTTVRRTIFFSTANVYGCDRPGELLDEKSEPRPDSWYAETKLEAEKAFLRQVPATVLRLTAVYGKGMKGNYCRLAHAIRKGRFVMVGQGENRRTLVHVNDVCDLAILAAENEAAEGQIYNVTDGAIYSLRDVIQCVASVLNAPYPRWTIPATPVQIASSLLTACGLRLGQEAVTRFLGDVAISGEKIRKHLASAPAIDLKTGFHQTFSAG